MTTYMVIGVPHQVGMNISKGHFLTVVQKGTGKSSFLIINQIFLMQVTDLNVKAQTLRSPRELVTIALSAN